MATKTKTHSAPKVGGGVKHEGAKKQGKFYSSCNSPNGCASPGKPKPGQQIVNEPGSEAPDNIEDKPAE